MASYGLLDGQVAIVTGSASGYGLGIAKLFHAEGSHVVIADISKSGEGVALDLSSEGPKCIFVETNVTRAADWKNVVDVAVATFGRLDILVNNAGWTYKRKDTLAVSEEEFDRVFDINVKSMFHAAHAILPHFISQRGGSIVNISSCITEKATTGLTWYGASKGAVDMITRHLATEYSSYGIRINAVSPSIGATALLGDFLGQDPTEKSLTDLKESIPVGRLCTPEDIAKAALYFASSYFNNFQTGIILRADGGTYA